MAEILALGISHYPPLLGHVERMSGILGRTAEEAGFVDTWIFKSSKTFLISRP